MTVAAKFFVPVEVAGPTGAVAATRYAGATASGAPASGTFLKGDFVIAQDGKVWICTAAGTPGTWASTPSGSGTSTGTNTGDVAFATPAVVLGTAAAAGSASTMIRSDATVVAFDATAPSTQAFGDAAAVGSAAVAARRDHKHAMPASPFSSGALASAPPASASSSLALGTAYQNTNAYDLLLVVFLSVTVNTSGEVKLGVGPTSTPTQQTIVTGVSTVGFLTVPIYLPASYYALLSISGVITDSIAGQIAMPV